jgi:hypothetical protein
VIRSTRSALGACAAALLAAACGDASSFTSPATPTVAPALQLDGRSADVGALASTAALVSGLSATLCLDVTGGTASIGANAVLNTCAPSAATQQFALPAAGTAGEVRLGALCLESAGTQGNQGDAVRLATCTSGINQRWTLSAGNELRGIYGRCVDVNGALAAPGARLVIWACHGQANQKWTARAAPPVVSALAPTAALVSGLGATLCLDVAGGSLSAGSPAVLNTCAPTSVTQQFALPAVGTPGEVRLGALCLESSGSSGRLGDAVWLGACAGSANQRWTRTTANELRGQNGLCIDVNGAVAAPGTRTVIWSCHGQANQKWTERATPAATVPPVTVPPVTVPPVTTVPPVITVPAAPPTLLVSGLGPTLCLGSPAGSGESAAAVLATCVPGATSQLFTLPAVEIAGEVRLGSLCLESQGPQGREGDLMRFDACTGKPNQRWTPTAAGELRGLNSYCVDVVGATTRPGTPLILFRCHGAANQKWRPAGSNTVVLPAAPPLAVASVSVTLNSSILSTGQSTQAVSAARDASGNLLARATTWSTSAAGVAVVSQTGMVTAVGPGTAAIVGLIDGKFGFATVTVTPPQEPPVNNPGTPAALAELPRVYLDTRYVEPNGRTINVAAGMNLQRVIDTARAGDLILLEAGATFYGNFRLVPKAGSERIVIRTNTALPAEGERMTPARAGNLAKLVSPTASAVLRTTGNASHYRIVGVEIAMASNVTYSWNMVLLGSTEERSMNEFPSDIVFDRVYLHGHRNLDIARCLGLNSASSAVIDSYISECHGRGRDSQAIAGWSGPGPYKIANNFLEGAGENVMFGGSSVLVQGLIPSDIEIRGNHLYKPMSWKSESWTVKNSFELKTGRRVLIDGNVFENNWAGAQIGFAIVMFSVDQDRTAPWSGVMDVTFSNNIVRNSPGAINIGARMANEEKARRFTFTNNLLERIGDTRLNISLGRMFQLLDDVDDVTIAHNTFVFAGDPVAKHSAVMLDGNKPSRLSILNNVTEGFVMTPGDFGTSGLSKGVKSWQMAGNVVVGAWAEKHPAGNFYPSSVSGVGFASWAGGDFRLGAGSEFRGRGTDGRDPGADFATLLARTAGAVQ